MILKKKENSLGDDDNKYMKGQKSKASIDDQHLTRWCPGTSSSSESDMISETGAIYALI